MKDTVYTGYIRSITDFGCFVSLPHGIIGVAGLRHLASRFINNPAENFEVGQTVAVKFLQIDSKERIQFSLDISPAELEQWRHDFLQSYFEDVHRMAEGSANALKVGTSSLLPRWPRGSVCWGL